MANQAIAKGMLACFLVLRQNTDQKQLGGENYETYNVQVPAYHCAKSGKSSVWQQQRKTHSASFPSAAQTRVPPDGAAQAWAGPSTSIISQDNLSQTWPQANLIWAISELSLPSDDSGLCQFDS